MTRIVLCCCLYSPAPDNQPDLYTERTSTMLRSMLNWGCTKTIQLIHEPTSGLTPPWKRSKHGSETSVLNHCPASDA